MKKIENNTYEIIQNKTFDEERALYGLKKSRVINCTFAGPADGESAFKESRGIAVENCNFSLRYPFWHSDTFTITKCNMDEYTRAAINVEKRLILVQFRADVNNLLITFLHILIF